MRETPKVNHNVFIIFRIKHKEKKNQPKNSLAGVSGHLEEEEAGVALGQEVVRRIVLVQDLSGIITRNVLWSNV